MVDEAQSLSTELLEEIRLLANIETTTEKLLPLVLVGQPELAARLEDLNLRQLKQRVALRCEITPFTLPETAEYIASRIRTAGGVVARLFTRQAVMVIHEHSRGIPRTISVMCDNALVSGFALGRQPVDREILLEVSRDFHLHGNGQGDGALYGAAGPEGLERQPTTRRRSRPIPITESQPVEEPQSGANVTPLARFKLFGGAADVNAHDVSPREPMSRIDEALKRRSGGGRSAPQKPGPTGPGQADVHSILEHYPREAGAPDELPLPEPPVEPRVETA